MEINILHLYYDIMNLYGEYGNIKILEKHLKDQNNKVYVDKKTIGDDIDISKYDFIYVGCGTERNSFTVLKDLLKYKNEIKKHIDDGKVMLMTGNSYELLGNKIGDVDAMKILDFDVEILKDRVTSDVIYSSKFFENKIVGFVNKMTNITHNLNPLFDVEFGCGENANKDREGIKYNNLYGMHVIGPVLVRNPEFLKKIIMQICLNKNKKFKYMDLQYENEQKAYELVLSELNKRRKK